MLLAEGRIQMFNGEYIYNKEIGRGYTVDSCEIKTKFGKFTKYEGSRLKFNIHRGYTIIRPQPLILSSPYVH